MVIVELHEFHGGTTAGAFERIITKRREDAVPPAVKGKEDLVLFFRDGAEEPSVAFPVARIDTIVAYLLEMFFGDMLYEAVYEIECGDGLHDKLVILMAVIMKSDGTAIITVYTGGGNDRSAKIAADIFGHSLWVTFIRFCVNIETVFVVSVDRGFDFFERRTYFRFQFIQESSLKGIPHEAVIEVGVCTPEAGVPDTALGDEAVDMGIPFEVASKGMEDTDKAGSEAMRLVFFMEHTEDDAAGGREKAVKEGAVVKEEGTQFFSNGEDTVAVCDVQNLKGHGSSTVDGVFCTAGGTETAVAAERDKFKFSTFVTAIHGTAERRVTTVKHPVDIPDDGLPGMEEIKHFFIMVFEDVLKNVHKRIMKDLATENNPTPQD